VYLKEIELENFKSFGRKMRIPFLKGFTAITGPNGSGKSNIADAILFVLGPKSSKAIRAGKLTDLIYNGGASRKAAKSCKVSLLFDNTDNVIPLEDDDVRLTRVVKRSTTKKDQYYSYFYVNGKPSSLGEFDNLLAHAQISAEGYNIVQQGDISRIVDMTNLDRRRILDNIAGITKFDTDIERANRKRAGVEENLGSIRILLNEIESRIEQLKRERDDALKYKEVKDKLDQNRMLLAFKNKQSKDAEIVHIQGQIEQTRMEGESLRARAGELREKKAAKETELRAVEDKLEELGGERVRTQRRNMDEARVELARAEDGIKLSRERAREHKETRLYLKEQLRKVRKELEKNSKRRAKLEADLEKAEAAKEKLSADMGSTRELITNHNSKNIEVNRDIVQLNRTIEKYQQDISAKGLEADRLGTRVEDLMSDNAQRDDTISSLEFALKDLEAELEQLEEGGDDGAGGKRATLEDYQGKRAVERKLRADLQKMEGRLTEVNREFHNLKARMEAQERYGRGFHGAVEAVLRARDSGELRGIHGTIAELAEVEPEYEDAITIAAGGRMQAVVVENDTRAAEAIAFLKKRRLGRATFLPLNKMVPGKPRGKALMAVRDSASRGFASDLVEYDDRYANAFWYVLGDTVVVDDLGAARKLMGGVRLVTMEGDLAEASGALIGGSLDAGGKAGGRKGGKAPKFGKRKGDAETLEELRVKRESIEGDMDASATRLQGLTVELQALEEKLRELNQEGVSRESREKDLRSELKDAGARLVTARKEREERHKRIQEMNLTIEKLEGEAEALEEGMRESDERKEELRKLMMEGTPKKLQTRYEELRLGLEEVGETLGGLRSELMGLGKADEVDKEREAEFEGRLEEVETGIREGNETEERLKEEVKGHRVRLRELKEQEKELDGELGGMGKERDELRDTISDLEHSINKAIDGQNTAADMVIKYKGNLQQSEQELADAAMEVEAFIRTAVERGEDAPEPPADIPPLDTLRRAIGQYESRLNQLGDVNMKALDEYDRQRERGENLNGELEKLETQRENLDLVVEELVGKKKAGLMRVLGEINSNFGEIFQRISKGGSAQLVLENPQEPFTAGLAIRVKLPGKKVLRVEALSGGEKSLTSMAFIFAIQRFEPSPFYLLDEVDQNLDGVNAEIIGKMVKENSSIAQFVMVSLRKVTIKEADHIYGVTIQKTSGISDIIGNVNIAEVGEEGEISHEGAGGGDGGGYGDGGGDGDGDGDDGGDDGGDGGDGGDEPGGGGAGGGGGGSGRTPSGDESGGGEEGPDEEAPEAGPESEASVASPTAGLDGGDGGSGDREQSM
jgi:chromosome segregation protein